MTMHKYEHKRIFLTPVIPLYMYLHMYAAHRDLQELINGYRIYDIITTNLVFARGGHVHSILQHL